MKHVPSPLQPAPLQSDVPKLPVDPTDAEFDAWMEALPPCPGIGFADDDDEKEDAEIDAEIAAQDWISHEVVTEWLTVRRKLGRVSFEEWFAKRNA